MNPFLFALLIIFACIGALCTLVGGCGVGVMVYLKVHEIRWKKKDYEGMKQALLEYKFH